MTIRKWLTPIVIIIISASLYWLLKPSATGPAPSTYQLPWQVDIHVDGTTTVFGIRLEHSSAADAIALLGIDHDLALIHDQTQGAGLELYFADFRSGPLKAKLVAQLQASAEQLEALQTHSETFDYTSSGARKYLLREEDIRRVMEWPIAALTLMPSASLKSDIVQSRFGEPQQKIQSSEGHHHWLYTHKGVDVVINDDGKDAIQYVAPRSFQRLLAPLQAVANAP